MKKNLLCNMGKELEPSCFAKKCMQYPFIFCELMILKQTNVEGVCIIQQEENVILSLNGITIIICS